MANQWEAWKKQEFEGLVKYCLGDIAEALVIMRVIHPRIDLPFKDDLELMEIVESKAKEY